MQGALAVYVTALSLLAGGCLVALTWRIVRRWIRPPPLPPHYLRLGRVAPDEPCPCGGEGRPYAVCCRPADVERLTEEVREFLWQRWSHRSFAGRRSSRSMQHRLEDYPIPPVTLPDWVYRPDRHTFPIEERRLRRWNPQVAAQRTAARHAAQQPARQLPEPASTPPSPQDEARREQAGSADHAEPERLPPDLGAR